MVDNFVTENSFHKDLLEELNDPIIKKFVTLPEDYEKRLALARGLQFSQWANTSVMDIDSRI